MMRLRLISSLCFILLIFGLVGCTSEPSLDPEAIRASGFIEGRIYTLAGTLGGRVEQVRVELGEEVGAGELLITLDSTQMEFLRKQAQAAVDAAEAEMFILEEIPSARDIAEAEAGVSIAEAELKAVEATLDLLISSYEPLDPPETDVHAAESAISVAEAGLSLAQAQLMQVKAGPLEGEREILDARLNEAQANLQLADRQLEEQLLVAPGGGIISQILVQAGEVVAPGSPVIYLMDPDHLTLTLYIPVVKVAKINMGHRFEITADSYPGEVFYGSVIHIADEAQFTPATVLTQEERVKLVFAVEILLEDSSGRLKPGMPVEAVIRPE